MARIDDIQELCNNICDIYNEEYSSAVINLRSYIQLLVANVELDKYKSLSERLEILKFIEEKYNNDIEGFLSFIKKLNKEGNTTNRMDIIEKILSEELGYTGDGIF